MFNFGKNSIPFWAYILFFCNGGIISFLHWYLENFIDWYPQPNTFNFKGSLIWIFAWILWLSKINYLLNLWLALILRFILKYLYLRVFDIPPELITSFEISLGTNGLDHVKIDKITMKSNTNQVNSFYLPVSVPDQNPEIIIECSCYPVIVDGENAIIDMVVVKQKKILI